MTAGGDRRVLARLGLRTLNTPEAFTVRENAET